MSRDPLALDRDAMRQMGYEVVDMLVERIARLPSEPVIRTATRAEMEARLAEPAPSEGRDFPTLLKRLDEEVLPFVGHFDHPREVIDRAIDHTLEAQRLIEADPRLELVTPASLGVVPAAPVSATRSAAPAQGGTNACPGSPNSDM